MNEQVNKVEEDVKKAFMESMDNELKKEFGFGIQTLMLFADAVYKVKTEKEKQTEEKFERAKHCIAEISDQFDRGKCSNDYIEGILEEYYKSEEHN